MSAGTSRATPARTLVVACGAIAQELVAVLEANALEGVAVECLPAEWHNRPERIAPAVEAKIVAAHSRGQRVLVAYGDCGSGGRLDAVLERHGVARLPGAHCYAFFAGSAVFDALAEAEPGTFYLTDYLARNFERLILEGLGIRAHPELADAYFGNYRRLLYLAQGEGPARLADARAAAEALGLPLEVHRTGLAPFAAALGGIGLVAA